MKYFKNSIIIAENQSVKLYTAEISNNEIRSPGIRQLKWEVSYTVCNRRKHALL